MCDGYSESTVNGSIVKTVYEFLGDYWHGCKIHFPQRDLKSSRTGQSMEELYALTRKRQYAIQKAGYKYVCIWECQFKEMLKQNHIAK
jgi:G:T-mismatch repair DNA endonuclease (very short patch repair protein)